MRNFKDTYCNAETFEAVCGLVLISLPFIGFAKLIQYFAQ